MSLISPVFLAFMAVTIFAYHLSKSVPYRQVVLTVASGVFLGSYVTDWIQLLPLAAFLAFGYAALLVVQARRQPATGDAGIPAVLAVSVAAVLLAYIYLKRFSFTEALAPSLPFPYLVIGLSYILFRVLHLVVDASAGDVPGRVGPFAFFRYTCNFLCFVSGPIQRYQDFATMDGVDKAALDSDAVYRAFSRIVTGYLKFAVIAASADYVYTNVSGHFIGTAPPGFPMLCLAYCVSAAAYTAYLYFNFSGYMDIVIGFGLMLGQVLPENFDRPFSARSFLEFWQRWHMTLSNWFKLYLFNPMLMALMARITAPGLTTYLGVVAFFVTFLIMGIWHGTTLVFVIYGLLMGAGASANKLWQIACAKRLGKKRYRDLSQSMPYAYAARGLTLAYFTVALTCLWLPDLPRYLGLAGQLGAAGIVAALAILTVCFAAGTLIADRIAAFLPAAGAAATGLFARNMSLALRILAVFAISSLFNKAPEFVYKAF